MKWRLFTGRANLRRTRTENKRIWHQVKFKNPKSQGALFFLAPFLFGWKEGINNKKSRKWVNCGQLICFFIGKFRANFTEWLK